eukprot:1464028-Rhodomonas_salina.2
MFLGGADQGFECVGSNERAGEAGRGRERQRRLIETETETGRGKAGERGERERRRKTGLGSREWGRERGISSAGETTQGSAPRGGWSSTTIGSVPRPRCRRGWRVAAPGA